MRVLISVYSVLVSFSVTIAVEFIANRFIVIVSVSGHNTSLQIHTRGITRHVLPSKSCIYFHTCVVTLNNDDNDVELYLSQSIFYVKLTGGLKF